MTPLHALSSFVRLLIYHPFDFLDSKKQGDQITNMRVTFQEMKTTLDRKQLQKTQAYITICHLLNNISVIPFPEAEFVKNLGHLLDIYSLSKAEEHTTQFLHELKNNLESAKKRILEYITMTEILLQTKKSISEDEQKRRDSETLQKIGVFFVLEYTVYVLYILPTLSDHDRHKIFYNGLKTPNGNIPSYTSQADNFRTGLCFKIFNDALRHSLLKAFYDFEAVFFTSQVIREISEKFKEFNLNLLALLKLNGIKNFETIFLSPLGKTVPLDELIRTLRALNVSTHMNN